MRRVLLPKKEESKNPLLVLTGMPGCGKTTIGREIASITGFSFTDSDMEIEKLSGMTIPQFFQRKGEKEFRLLEKKIIRHLLVKKGPHILATGGGAIMDHETQMVMKKKALRIWLKENDLKKLSQRIVQENKRPLLSHSCCLRTIENLMDKRYSSYTKTDITLMTNNRSPGKIAQEILGTLYDDGFRFWSKSHA